MTASKKELALTREEVLEMLELRLTEYVFYWLVKTSPMSRIEVGSRAGYLNKAGYTVIQINGTKFYAHRLVWFVVYGRFPKGVIDHIDGDKSNNRLENLRDVSQKVNNQNTARQNRRDADLPTGVFVGNRNKFGEVLGYKAQWCDMSGKSYAVYHSIKEYCTSEAALAAAIARREFEMSTLMSQGADYTERHGKQDGQL